MAEDTSGATLLTDQLGDAEGDANVTETLIAPGTHKPTTPAVVEDEVVVETEEPADADTGDIEVDETTEDDTKDSEGEDGTESGKDDDGETGAPEKYEFEFPEGMQIDDAALTEAEEVFREIGLTQKQASRLVEIQTGIVEQQQTALAEQSNAWAKDAKSDKEIGGDHFDANLRGARAILRNYGSEELSSLLEQTGLGNHPEVIRLFSKIKGAFSEDSFNDSTASQSGERTEAEKERAAHILAYPTMFGKDGKPLKS